MARGVADEEGGGGDSDGDGDGDDSDEEGVTSDVDVVGWVAVASQRAGTKFLRANLRFAALS